MSHFRILAILKPGESLEEVMAPYDENWEVEPYVYKTRTEIIEQGKEIIKDIDKYSFDWETKLKFMKDDITDDELYDLVIDTIYPEYDIDKNGNIMTTYNPNSKWDYWTEMGVNNYFSDKKDLGYRCKVKKFKVPKDEECYKEAIRFWEIVVDEEPLEPGEQQPFTLYRKEYYLERYKTKRNYAEQCCKAEPYAFILNGEWIAPGTVGWFACDDATYESQEEYSKKFEEVLKNPEYADYEMALVDCHI